MKLDNKGFTLVEVIVVVGIIVLISIIAVPNVLRALNTGKNKSYDIMVQNIKTGAINLYEEVYSNKLLGDSENVIYKYSENGLKTGEKVEISDDLSIVLNLQTLVSNGYLSGSASNNGVKTIYEPKENMPIGGCSISITRNVNNDRVTYTITPINSGEGCPISYN